MFFVTGNCFIIIFLPILERLEDKTHIFNLSSCTEDRVWLRNVLLSDSETDSEISDQDEYIREMLKNHVREKKYREKYYLNMSVSIAV